MMKINQLQIRSDRNFLLKYIQLSIKQELRKPRDILQINYRTNNSDIHFSRILK